VAIVKNPISWMFQIIHNWELNKEIFDYEKEKAIDSKNEEEKGKFFNYEEYYNSISEITKWYLRNIWKTHYI